MGSITFRIAALVAGLTVGLTVFLGLALYLAVASQLAGGAREAARQQALDILRRIDGTSPEQTEPWDPDLMAAVRPGNRVVILDASGRTLNSNLPAGAVAAPGAVFAQVSGRAAGEPVRVGAAVPFAREEAFLASLRGTLLRGAAVAVLCAALLGRFAARRALRPIGDIVAAVERISASGLAERLPADGPRDELQRLRHAFNGMMDRIQDAFQRQTRFVADAAHELRTPVSILDGYARMLLRWGREDPAVLDEGLRAISRESSYLARLTASLLALARGEAEREILLQPVALDEVARDLVAAAAGMHPGAAVRCDVPGSPVRVLADPDLVREIGMIYLDNAFRHGAPPVTVSVKREPATARLCVRDAGRGVPADLRPRLFERFARGGAGRGGGAGAGIGLAIARALARSMGGAVGVTEDGTRFYIELRLAPPA